MSEPTNVWGWYDNFYRDALWKGDEKRQQLHELRQLVANIDLDQPYEQNVAPIEHGLALANELNEPYWYIFFEYARSRLLYNKYKVQAAIDAATRLVVEIRKPQYRECPLLGRCYLNLISAYTSFDPVGYEQEITDAIAYAKQHFSNDEHTTIEIALSQIKMYIALEDWNKAKDTVLQYQAWLKRGDALLKSTILGCQIAYKLKDDKLLKAQIEMGNGLLDKFPETGIQVILMIWQAIWLLRRGEIASAKKMKANAVDLRRQANVLTGFEIETALFYYQLSEPNDQISALRLVDQFSLSYSPYYDCVRRLRAYYVLRNQDWINRWMYIFINHFGKSRLYNITKPIPALMRLAIYLPIGSVLNLKHRPEQRAFKNVRDIAKTMRKPEFYTERIMRIEERTSYVP